MENIIQITAEDGKETSFEFLDLIEYLGQQYVVLLPVDEDDEEVVILKVDDSNDSDEECYVGVENDEIVQAVFKIFKEKNKDEFNFQDEKQNATSGPVKYRSRFALWFVAWFTAFAGGHFNWLGFKEAGEAWRAEHGVIRAAFNPVCWIVHCWEQIAIIFGKYRTDAYGNPVRHFALIRNLLKK